MAGGWHFGSAQWPAAGFFISDIWFLNSGTSAPLSDRASVTGTSAPLSGQAAGFSTHTSGLSTLALRLRSVAEAAVTGTSTSSVAGCWSLFSQTLLLSADNHQLITTI